MSAGRDGLLLDQLEHDVVEHVAVLDQDLPGLVVRELDQRAHLAVDLGGDRVGVVPLVAHRAAQERLVAAGAVLDGAELGAHAVLGDHGPGQRRGLLDVVAGTGGGLVEDELLGGPAAQRVRQGVDHLGAGLGVLVLGRQHQRVTERAAARQDRHLVHRRGVRQRPGDQRVAALVVGGDLLLVVAHHAGARAAGRR